MQEPSTVYGARWAYKLVFFLEMVAERSGAAAYMEEVLKKVTVYDLLVIIHWRYAGN